MVSLGYDRGKYIEFTLYFNCLFKSWCIVKGVVGVAIVGIDICLYLFIDLLSRAPHLIYCRCQHLLSLVVFIGARDYL